MSGRSAIEWTQATWNPVRGCTRVSEGCRHCYAERTAVRFSGPGQPYDGLVRITNGHPQWTGEVAFIEKHLRDPLTWKEPRRVFVNSMSDLFHEGLADSEVDRIFAMMALCPQHTFQVLTKRPQRMRAYLSEPGRKSEVAIAMAAEAFDEWTLKGRSGKLPAGTKFEERGTTVPDFAWPLPNVWLGVSVENQAAADERIPLLLQTPAALRWISAEPLLGPINVGRWLDPLGGLDGTYRRLISRGMLNCYQVASLKEASLDWVVAGGESGPGARPMHPEWARSLRDQCAAASVPFFFKQWGEIAPGRSIRGGEDAASRSAALHRDGFLDTPDCCSRSYEDTTAEDGAVEMTKVGKRAAGRLLDGREHNEYPAVQTSAEACV